LLDEVYAVLGSHFSEFTDASGSVGSAGASGCAAQIQNLIVAFILVLHYFFYISLNYFLVRECLECPEMLLKELSESNLHSLFYIIKFNISVISFLRLVSSLSSSMNKFSLFRKANVHFSVLIVSQQFHYFPIFFPCELGAKGHPFVSRQP
jgi:hypothetical protein